MMTVEIPLTQGYVALVDDADAGLVLAQGKWFSKRERRRVVAGRSVRREDGSRTTLRMHTFLTGWPLVDHINGDTLDNRRANLRAASNAENARNRGLSSSNTSGYKGVSWYALNQAWVARIGVNGTKVNLGSFPTAAAAAAAYDAAAVEYHGEFARLNFPADVAHHTDGV